MYLFHQFLILAQKTKISNRICGKFAEKGTAAGFSGGGSGKISFW